MVEILRNSRREFYNGIRACSSVVVDSKGHLKSNLWDHKTSRTLPTGEVGEEPEISLGGKKKKWLEKKGQERQHHLSHLRAKELWGNKMIPRSTIFSISWMTWPRVKRPWWTLWGSLLRISWRAQRSRTIMVMGVQIMERAATHALPCRATPTCTPNPSDPLCLNLWGMRPQVHWCRLSRMSPKGHI